MRSLFSLLAGLLRFLWALLTLLTPLLGVWLGSSLVSFYGLRAELALAAGVLLFPILPILWELRATAAWNRARTEERRMGKPPVRWLSGLERLVLRTMIINLAFLGGLLGYFPKVAFSALATRGDWFLFEKQCAEEWHYHYFKCDQKGELARPDMRQGEIKHDTTNSESGACN